VWADALQLAVYMAGGVAALWIAVDMAGGAQAVWSAADGANKLRLFDFSWSISAPYAFIGALIGGAMLSAASHGADHIIVQRLLATRSLRDAQWALSWSGVLVFIQFALFLAVGMAVWSAGHAPKELASDQIFSRFIISYLPAGVAGLVVAAILAAAMSTISSSISALASSMTNDLYANLTGHTEPAHLLKVGQAFSLLWGVLLIGGALGFYALGSSKDTPVVVLALSIASVTYGALLGALILAALPQRKVVGKHVLWGAGLALTCMLLVVFAKPLSAAIPALSTLGQIAWPWYVPMGTVLTLGIAYLFSNVLHIRNATPNL
jgi:solute:Na+ symporter, SSS family